MKKSNKLTVFYVISSITLFLVLLFGGIYGVYVSVGLNFVRGAPTTNGVVGENVANNVSFGGTVNYAPSMTGVIFLSLILVIISIFDLISMIKQIVFFKQFRAVRDSNITKKIEQKTPSKGGVIFLTFVVDVVALIAGIAGLFINNRSFVSGIEMSWVFYLVDGLVSALALLSIILLIAKLKNKATENKNIKKVATSKSLDGSRKTSSSGNKKRVNSKDINQMEYNLMKLESMKKGKIVTDDEYKKLRRKILNFKGSENIFADSQKDY